MQRSALPVLLLLAIGCEGRLIDSNFPGGNQPPTTNAALAFRFGGPGSELVADMATDATGNIYLAGSFTGSPDFDPDSGLAVRNSLGSSDGFLAKYSGSGALLWVAQLGGINSENVAALARDAAGNLYVGGSFSGSTDFDPGAGLQVLISSGGQDGFVAKYTADGGLVWARRFGGPNGDEVSDLTVDAAGNVYAVGSFSGQANALPAPGPTILGDGSSNDGFVLALDAGGTVRWAIPLGGSLADAARAVALSGGGAGNLVVAGDYHGSADFSRNGAPTRLVAVGGSDAFLATYSTLGVLQWVRDIGGLGEETVTPGGVALDAQGAIALLGAFSGAVDFDPGAGSATRTSVSGGDVFVARYDAGGNFSSVTTLGGLGSVSGVRLLTDLDGSVLLTGWFRGPIDFALTGGGSVHILTSLGLNSATDAFVARYSATGTLLWVSRFGESTTVADRSNSGTALALDPGDRPLVAGRFFGSPDFDPGNSALHLTSVGQADAFVVKLTAGGSLATTP